MKSLKNRTKLISKRKILLIKKKTVVIVVNVLVYDFYYNKKNLSQNEKNVHRSSRYTNILKETEKARFIL